MPRRFITLNSDGIAAVLKSESVKDAIEDLTKTIAENVEAMGIKVGDRDGGPLEYPLPVKTSITETDRAKGRVTLAHPAGQAVQAKHGALTKAAGEAGLDVSGA